MELRKKKVRGGNRTPLLQQTKKKKETAESDSVVFLKMHLVTRLR